MPGSGFTSPGVPSHYSYYETLETARCWDCRVSPWFGSEMSENPSELA